MKTLTRQRNIAGPPVRLLALGGIVGPVLFAVVVVVAASLYDGYSHIGQAISELGGEGAHYALLQSANFFVLGTLVIGFAWALARTPGVPALGAVLVGLFGLSSGIGNALLPCDLGCAGQTAIGLLHNITGMLGFLAAIVGMFLLARRWQQNTGWKSHIGFTRGGALVAIIGLVGFVATKATGIEIYGLAQRVFVGALMLWIVVTALRLYRQSD